ncbi:hypothetical protein [Sphingomonas psychrotolerans]|uniref:Uncharacterized protein n=1 Tax=Sphingomonas psychrotolerans TaxID=1327635 RepID=A0A2K8MSB4_9SPHN|nr:hypothetical protein [Sphingomonas psychrotolerans]ATY34909.1 hypothetical protein CVN68_22625 [Sphingomonas psychrotolerans]
MTLRILFAAALLFLPTTFVSAQGFATRDLASLAKDMERVLGPHFISRTEDGQVALSCLSCPSSPIVGVALGRQNDGTEQRVREGKTTIQQLRAQCRARDPSCELTALNVAPAVGWITSYRMGSMAGATAVIIRDGDVLTIRSLSEDPAIARANAVKMTSFAHQIIGK